MEKLKTNVTQISQLLMKFLVEQIDNMLPLAINKMLTLPSGSSRHAKALGMESLTVLPQDE